MRLSFIRVKTFGDRPGLQYFIKQTEKLKKLLRYISQYVTLARGKRTAAGSHDNIGYCFKYAKYTQRSHSRAINADAANSKKTKPNLQKEKYVYMCTQLNKDSSSH